MQDDSAPEFQVMDLQRRGWLLVEDGNHGEYRPRPGEFGSGTWAFIRAADMDGGQVLFHSAQRINDVARKRITKGVGAGGDVLLSHKGTVGKLALVPLSAPPFVCSPQTTFWRVRDEARIDRRYLYYFMCSEEFRQQLDSRKGETDMADYVSLTAQRDLWVTLPSIDRQKTIARILGALDKKIELNRRMNRTLEDLARSMFKSWFVDFDPVVAKAAGKKPIGMSAKTAALFPDSFQDSSLGPIPKEWTVGRVGNEYKLTMGQSPPGDTYNETDEGTPFFQGRTDFTFRFPVRRVCCTAPTRFAEPQDTLVSVRAPVGDINMAMERCAVGRGVAAARHRSGSRSYTYYAMGALADAFATFDGDGTLFGSIGKTDFEGIMVVVPPDELIERFSGLAGPLDDRIEQNEHQIATLSALRDALLPQLMSGELRLTEAEQAVLQAT